MLNRKKNLAKTAKKKIKKFKKTYTPESVVKLNKEYKKRYGRKNIFQKMFGKIVSAFKKVAGAIKKFHLPRVPWKTGLFTLLLGTDMLMKKHVDETMVPGETKEFWGGNLKIRQVYNKGFMLDTLGDRPDLVKKSSIGMAGLLTVYNTWLMNTKGHFIKKLGMVIMDAGAVSNIFDRLFRGKVVDYIGIKTENDFLSKITANLADVYVFIGSVITSLGR